MKARTMGNPTNQQKRKNRDFSSLKASVSLEAYAVEKLEPRGRHTFVCPACGSGDGPNRTAAFSVRDGVGAFHCFACGAKGDIFDLAGILEKTDSRAEQYDAVAEWAGLEGGEPRPKRGQTEETRTLKAPKEAEPTADQLALREAERGKVAAARAAMRRGCEGWGYLEGRGFTADEISRFGLGWDAGTRRVVIPWSDSEAEWYHQDRAIDADAEPRYNGTPSRACGQRGTFGLEDAIEGDVCFVAEGPLDALSLRAAGASALALTGAGNAKRVAREIVESGYGRRGSVVLWLDSDERGREAAEEMRGILERGGVATFAPDLDSAWAYKDPSEALGSDRAALVDRVTEATIRARENRSQAIYGGLGLKSAADGIESLFLLEDSAEPTPTGIEPIDRALGGGLPRGLVVLGAVSSLGKTTLMLQIADHIAAGGRPVLFVSCEQSVAELQAKSLSRLMKPKAGRIGYTEVLQDSARRLWGTSRLAAFAEVAAEYHATVGPNLVFYEPDGQPSAADVRERAEAIAAMFGRPPIVCVDYLQLLAPMDPHDSDKHAVDMNILALRQLCRELRTTTLCVSSLNRQSYSGYISEDSFKESGAIEYGSDLLMGLQPAGIKEKVKAAGSESTKKQAADDMTDAAKTSTVRDLELVVLKFRGGKRPDAIPLTFDAAANTFGDRSKVSRLDGIA